MAETGFKLWTYRHRFTISQQEWVATYVAGIKGSKSTLATADRVVAQDFTPLVSEGELRNHHLATQLDDGRNLEVEMGYYNWWDVASAARLQGELIHESHPGMRIELPERAKRMMAGGRQRAAPPSHIDLDKLKAGKVPFLVDILTGLLFYIVAKMTDLTTAALVGAGVGIALAIIQRFVRVDLIGGMALFGIVMLLISAGFAWFFQDDNMVKMRSTIVGLIGAAFFLGDGILLRGQRLGAGMARYIAYSDINARRLSIGVGLTGLVMAGLNWVVAKLASKHGWLLYHSFLDTFVAIVLVLIVMKWARSGPRA